MKQTLDGTISDAQSVTKKVKFEKDFWCNHCKSNFDFPISRQNINYQFYNHTTYVNIKVNFLTKKFNQIRYLHM